MAEVFSDTQTAAVIGAEAAVDFGTQVTVGRDHLVLRIYEEPCINGRFRLHFNLDCREPSINVDTRTQEFDFSREDLVADQYAKLEQAWIADGSDYDRFMRRLRAHGIEMYDHLVPEKVRIALWRHRAEIGTVQVISEEPFIPWEIAYITDPAGHGREREGFLGGPGFTHQRSEVERYAKAGNFRASLALRNVPVSKPRRVVVGRAPLPERLDA
jgi:hypothetical protein